MVFMIRKCYLNLYLFEQNAKIRTIGKIVHGFLIDKISFKDSVQEH
jgi:hypothetical protein